MRSPLAQARNLVPRHAWVEAQRARFTVVPHRIEEAPRAPFVGLVSLVLAAGVVGLLMFNTQMQQGSFVASSMEKKAAALAGKEQALRMQLGRLRDPQHLAERAKNLGMAPAPDPAFIRLSDGKILGRPTVATAADAVRLAPPPAAKPNSLRPRLFIVKRTGHWRHCRADSPTGKAGHRTASTARGSGSRMLAEMDRSSCRREVRSPPQFGQTPSRQRSTHASHQVH